MRSQGIREGAGFAFQGFLGGEVSADLDELKRAVGVVRVKIDLIAGGRAQIADACTAPLQL